MPHPSGPSSDAWCRGFLPGREFGLGASSDAPGLSLPHEHRRQSAGAPALVVFVDETACPWLRPLRRGFRHCFVVLRAGPLWLACEPLKDRIELDALDLPPGFDLGRFYSRQGHRVLLGRRPPPRPKSWFALAPVTCVTVVKRLLGIRAPWVWSPWQLYSHLCGPMWRFCPWSEEPELARPGSREADGVGAQLGA